MSWTGDKRPTPEELLARIHAAEGKGGRGRLKIFLGFAAGVGKTYEMLNEAHRRRQRGQDVVIGYVETHGRAGTQEQIGDLEMIPRKKITYRDAAFEEMDPDAIIARHPMWVLVDELAHTNVPGSVREKRWQDVELIRDAGINVSTTLNVQHLESLNDSVASITGIRVRETVPDRIVKEADEVKMVDVTPRALIHRLERGDIYSPEKVEQALKNWFQENNLSALRELALREIAEDVDEDVLAARRRQNAREPLPTVDRVMVCVAPTRPALRLLRRGWRMAQRLHGTIVAVFVEEGAAASAEPEILRNTTALAQRLGVPFVTLHGDVAGEIIRYAREHEITQIVMGHSSRTRWQEFVSGSLVSRLARDLRAIDILIVAAPEDATAGE